MNTPELPFTDDHIETALEKVSEFPNTDRENLPTVSEIKEILAELQHYTHSSEWANIQHSINNNHVDIEHLSKDALIIGTSYEAFNVPLDEMGYVDDEDTIDTIVRIIQLVHKIAGEDVFDVTTAPDIYTLVTTLPEREH